MMTNHFLKQRFPSLRVVPPTLQNIHRQMFKILVIFGEISILTASLAIPTAAQSSETKVSPSSGGYAIFHETMADMTWPEVEQAAQAGAIVLFPLAVIEEHGPHVALGVDTYLITLQTKLVQRELEERGIHTLIAPPFYWGINHATRNFPGSFTVRKETMQAVLYDTIDSLHRWGFTRMFLFDGHGDPEHNNAILEAVQHARKKLGSEAYYVLSTMKAQHLRLRGKEPYLIQFVSPRLPGEPLTFIDVHAGTWETSAMLAYFPELVDPEIAKTLEPTDLSLNALFTWLQDARKVTPLGYVGNPANFRTEDVQQQ